MTRVAAVLVTSNSERWIGETAASVLGQSRQPDEVVVIDDGSTDATPDILTRTLGDRVRIVPSTAQSAVRASRIAHNFRQGLQECRHADIAVLGDHDDVWRQDRVRHQVGLLEERPTVTLLASDGRLIDEGGDPLGGSLRDAFPVPAGFNELAAGERMRIVLRRSVATGGASAVRPSAFAFLTIPDGWLHDRWWSLVAMAREELWVDDERVIDYRVSADQVVGLDTGHQDRPTLGRMMAAASGLRSTMSRIEDIRAWLPGFATDATRPALTGPRLLRNLM